MNLQSNLQSLYRSVNRAVCAPLLRFQRPVREERGFTLPASSSGSHPLREAQSRFPGGSPLEWERFAHRQRRARLRLTRLLAFYHDCSCCMSRTHLLAACAIVLGRFCGHSAAFDVIGEALMPVTAVGEPRTALWAAYAESCGAGQPRQVREERWLAAHMADLEQVREAGLDVLFYAEAEMHPSDPTWLLLRRHMEVTVGERVLDAAALKGMVAYETAMSENLARGLRRLLTAGLRLLLCYAKEAARALVLPADLRTDPSLCPPPATKRGRPLLSMLSPLDVEVTSDDPYKAACGDRRCALLLVYYAVAAWSAAGIYRRGVRQRDRGRQADTEGWPLLEQVLGERLSEVHPLILRFYRNPSPFQVRASLHLHTLPARVASRLATLLTGQGLYEEGYSEIETRFRVFRRADGSMHFLRELICGGTLRVFDSDFVVRRRNGCSTLTEVFADLSLAVEMQVLPAPNGALAILGQRILWRGIPLPTFGLRIEFLSRVEQPEASQEETLHIEGFLKMQPRTPWGRFLAHTLLRRPEVLGSIRYRVRPRGQMGVTV